MLEILCGMDPLLLLDTPMFRRASYIEQKAKFGQKI